MVVYHGTTLEITHPQILTSEIGRDFGFAFYTTDIREQAERWAIRRAKIQCRKEKRPVSAIVNEYEWNRSDDLEIMEFSGASMEWLDMVVQCRSNPAYRHFYDIVTGKIANDNVGETASHRLQVLLVVRVCGLDSAVRNAGLCIFKNRASRVEREGFEDRHERGVTSVIDDQNIGNTCTQKFFYIVDQLLFWVVDSNNNSSIHKSASFSLNFLVIQIR